MHTSDSDRRILVVEDQDDSRDALCELLKLWGYQADGAADGRRGVEQARASRPRLALVDITLPELDGYQVAQLLRAEMGRAIHLVAMTGYSRPEDRERALAAGFDDHYVKPVEPNKLQELLSQITGGP